MNEILKNKVKECPHCGSEDGYYTKDYVKGHARYFFNFDGEEADNTEYYEGIQIESGKVAYCTHCNRKIFKMEDL